MAEEIPEKGLVVGSPYIERILSGEKTWEMRSRGTRTRGSIALIKKGSGTVVGLAKLVDVKGPLTSAEILANVDKHRRNFQEINDPALQKRNMAWVLSDIRRLNTPIPYRHNSGAVIFVKLDEDVRRNIADQIGSSFIRANRIFDAINFRQTKKPSPKKTRKRKNNQSGWFAGFFGLLFAIILAVNFGFFNTIIFFIFLGIIFNPKILSALPGLIIAGFILSLFL